MVNPHSWIYMDVKDESGKVVNWKFETASPSNLFRRGFRKDSIKPGMQVTLEGYLAKDGSPTANGQRLHMHSDQLRVIERYTLQDENTLIWEATLTDPKVFTRPVKIRFPLVRAAKDYAIMESGCYEDERDQAHLKDLSIPTNHYNDEREKEKK